ncbi:anhydro-N-acetylmuramic acid kinase [Actibacterium sp. 188UL27-1]|uniref:anhydro-N-acetylmuramic acid kinase n=1 Tax=Actibacterium sp. 188UL27-1 TaxID=2786961 RepID=UPI00195606CC|nr:anhydro-N-acetylmuramic acid kinase [Actibacterium sp. 188UL27-1]MBM7067726.1 anhydro-N-acetylmuramic acid kinase [Actibacterium sp. 188UL27-1]
MERMRVLGAMSGTSLDGVDAAVIETDGTAILAFGPSRFRAYTGEEQAVLRAALGRWPGAPGVAEAAQVVEAAHAEVLGDFTDIDLVAFHGQTLAHDPAAGRTHQAGDGAALARRLGVPVAWDFRSADVAAGGQGAPLSPAYHFALAKWRGLTAPVAFLNLGGVGNLTWLDPRRDMAADPGAILAFDTGPANAPINDAMMARRGDPFDRDGILAARGKVQAEVLAQFLTHPYFAAPPPKSLDRDDFRDLGQAVSHLSDADAVATLAAAAAAGVAQGVDHFPAPVERVLVTGGGRRNPVLMAMIADHLACPVEPVEAEALDGDMLEAQAFAYLAARTKLGLPISFPATTGIDHPLSGGSISPPA